MTTEKEQLEAEIAKRDARIAELEAENRILEQEISQQPSAGVVDERAAFDAAWPSISENLPSHQREPYSVQDVERAEHDAAREGWQARARLDQPTASAGVVVGALVSALEGIVHDERVPNEVSQDYAALLIEARRLNPCRAQAVPDGYVVVPERMHLDANVIESINYHCGDGPEFEGWAERSGEHAACVQDGKSVGMNDDEARQFADTLAKADEPATHLRNGWEVRARRTWKAGNPSWLCANCNKPIMEHEKQTFCPEGPTFASNSTNTQPARQAGGDERGAFEVIAKLLGSGNYLYRQGTGRYKYANTQEAWEIMQAALAQPASQVGGDEPEYRGRPIISWIEQIRDKANGDERNALSIAIGFISGAALAPSAAAVVVMPDRMEPFPDDDAGRRALCAGWNACLDELARLNRRTVSLELLERILNEWAHGTFGGWSHAMGELRALLAQSESEGVKS